MRIVKQLPVIVGLLQWKKKNIAPKYASRDVLKTFGALLKNRPTSAQLTAVTPAPCSNYPTIWLKYRRPDIQTKTKLNDSEISEMVIAYIGFFTQADKISRPLY